MNFNYLRYLRCFKTLQEFKLCNELALGSSKMAQSNCEHKTCLIGGFGSELSPSVSRLTDAPVVTVGLKKLCKQNSQEKKAKDKKLC